MSPVNDTIINTEFKDNAAPVNMIEKNNREPGEPHPSFHPHSEFHSTRPSSRPPDGIRMNIPPSRGMPRETLIDDDTGVEYVPSLLDPSPRVRTSEI